MDFSARVVVKRTVSGVRDQMVVRRIDVDRRQFLGSRRILGQVAPVVGEPAASPDRVPVESQPHLENTLPWNVLQRPLHRDALDIDRVPVASSFKNFGTVSEGIPGLDGIPTQPLPSRRQDGARRLEWNWPGVERKLNLAPPVETVHDIAFGVVGGREKSDRATLVKVDPHSNRGVLGEQHVRGGGKENDHNL